MQMIYRINLTEMSHSPSAQFHIPEGYEIDGSHVERPLPFFIELNANGLRMVVVFVDQHE